jgi:GTP-binding protein
MSVVLEKTTFWKSFENYDQLPDDDGSEVVFAGRSNAGKSSALNALTNRRKLAHVSKLPGRTRLLNFFEVSAFKYLVDLPGYGYAKVPDQMRKSWGKALTLYLKRREQITGLFAVIDIRHALTELDYQLIEWFSITGRPLHLLLTKSDKLTRAQADRKLSEVSAILAKNYPWASAQIFSSTSKAGVPEAREKLADWLDLT